MAQLDPTRTRLLRDEYARELRKLPVRARKRALEILAVSPLNDDLIPAIQAAVESEMGDAAARPVVGRLTKIAWMRGADFAVRQLKSVGIEFSIAFSIAVTDDETLRVLEELSLDYVKKLSEEVKGNIAAEIRQGLIKGEHPRKIADRIRVVEKMSKYRAEMIARTETIRVFNTAADQRYRAAGAKRWKWLASGDERMCSICSERDGKIYNMGDDLPPRHPNCRCVTIPLFGSGSEKRSKETAQKPKEYVPTMSSSSTTIKDAEKWAVENLGVDSAKYTGLNVEVANEINQSISSFKRKFPNLKLDEITTIKRTKYGRPTFVMQNAAYGKLDKTTRNRLEINKAFFSKEKTLSELNTYIKSKAEDGWWIPENLEQIVVHEMGHTMTYQKRTMFDAHRVNSELKYIHFTGLSEYAKENGAEGIAECFAKYVRDGNLAGVNVIAKGDVINIIKKYTGENLS